MLQYILIEKQSPRQHRIPGCLCQIKQADSNGQMITLHKTILVLVGFSQKSKQSMSACIVSPKSPQLPREPWGTIFRKRVSDMKLHLGRYQVLVSQQLQLPHPASFHQLKSDVLRVGAQPAGCLIQTESRFFHNNCK